MRSPGGDGREARPLRSREGRLADYLASRDRGEVVAGRILQRVGPDTVRVLLGPGVLTARAVGGEPVVGPCRLEIIAPGPRPVLRIVSPGRAEGIEVRVDASREKFEMRAGLRVDLHG